MSTHLPPVIQIYFTIFYLLRFISNNRLRKLSWVKEFSIESERYLQLNISHTIPKSLGTRSGIFVLTSGLVLISENIIPEPSILLGSDQIVIGRDMKSY